jgi:predicted dehydrogenase
MAVQAEQIQRQASRPAEKVGPLPFQGEGRVRVALIGCGAAMRQLHLPVLAGHGGGEVVALVDRDLKRANDLASAYRVPVVLDDSVNLGRDLVDAAVVCTPPFHHAPGAIEMARKGLHVLVEKPMATRYADGEEMVRTAREAGVVLSIGVFRRLLPATRMLRGLIDAGVLGLPLWFDVEEGEVYAWPTATLGNHRRDLAGGGVLIDFGSHMLDRLLFFFPGQAEVLEYHDNARGGIESDCVAQLRLTTAAGQKVEGRVELSRTRNLRNTFRIRCERGVLELPAGERYRVSIQPRDTTVIDPLEGIPRACQIEAGWKGQEEAPWFEAFRAQVDDWLGAIRAGSEPTLSGVPPGGAHAGHSPKRRVLVPGATGFIGGRLAEVLRLREGWDVRALVHNPGRASRLACLPVEMAIGDLHSEQDARRLVEGCDAVAHCAIGTAWGNRREIFDVTVGGTRRLSRAALAAGVGRFVHISTFAVHDLTRAGVIDESTPPTPPPGNDYAESKLAADRVIEDAVRQGLCATTLRLANVYGPHSTIWVTRPLSHLARGKPPVKGETFTISDGDEMTWAEFYGFFAQAVGRQFRAISDEELARRQASGHKTGLFRRLFLPIRSTRDVLTSPEMWGLIKRVLKSEPLYSAGKWVLEKMPPLKRRAHRLLGIDTPVVYRKVPDPSGDEAFELELTRPLVRNDKAREVLGLRPPVSRDRALELTLAWLKHSRIVP